MAVLFFIPSLITAENADSIKIIVNDQGAMVIKDFRIKDDKVYLSAQEAFSDLGLQPKFSSDQNYMFFKIGAQSVTVDLKSAKAIQGARELVFSGVLRDGQKLYLAEDFFSQVYAPLKGVKVRVEKPASSAKIETNENLDNGCNLPDKFKRDPVDIVVIDPGHGGENFGANTADGWREKDLTLRIGQRVKYWLGGYPEIKVYLTRETDKYLDLDSRTEFANKLGADLFLSIHINGAEALSASGFETFFMSLKSSDEDSRKLAMWENLELSGAEINQAGLAQEEISELELILGDMAQTEHLAESDFFARIVQKNMDFAMQQAVNRGLRQAPFRVLMTANMPAALVEVGFLTNAADRKNITDPAVQDKIAKALAKSILEFRNAKAKKIGMEGKNESGKEKSKSDPNGGNKNRGS